MKQAIKKNTLTLTIFAVTCTALVGAVNFFTKDIIATQQQQELLKTLYQVIPAERLDNDLANDCQFIQDKDLLGSSDIQTAYIARKDNIPVAIAITSIAPDGYSGKINLLVAINVDGSLSGVRVIHHNETPGLGDKVETRRSDWIYAFNGKVLSDENNARWAVKKDGGMFDQFTGATITPRAVVKAIKNTILYFNANKESLLSNNQSCRGTNDEA
jgi:electron transport complex protein RnfG